MQFPHECFVIALSHRTTKNITTMSKEKKLHLEITTDDFAGVNLDEGIVHGWANFKNAKTFLTDQNHLKFLSETIISLKKIKLDLPQT